ncbi:GMC oxidoreductase [Leptolyngbya sp. GB1-A1]|uniref:GMC oxidoreductase n=1 Tax=Leptolyngbya sp. GB1-A1 TaxID=2933908 RepID=UPI003298139B
MFLPSVHHHMGTTWMHDGPKQGIVDATCRVHGVSNLHIPAVQSFQPAVMQIQR